MQGFGKGEKKLYRGRLEEGPIALPIVLVTHNLSLKMMRDWKLENLANGKEISTVPFRADKEDYLWR